MGIFRDQRLEDRAAEPILAQALAAGRDHVILHGGQRLGIGRVCKARDVDRIGLVPDGRRHRARRDDDDVDTEEHELAPERLRQALEREFRGVVGTDKGRGVLATHRRDHHDTAGPGFARRIGHEQRREGLGDDQLSRQVDVDLVTELVDRDVEERTRHRDSRIVDESEKRLALELLRGVLGGGPHGGLIGDVEEQRRKIHAEFLLQSLGIRRLLAHAAEDAEALSRRAPSPRHVRCQSMLP